MVVWKPTAEAGAETGSHFPQPLKTQRSAHPGQGRGKSTLPFPAGVQQDEVQGRLLLLHLLEDPLHTDAVLRGVRLWSVNRDHVVPSQVFVPMTSVVEYSWEQGEERRSHDGNLQVCNHFPTAMSHILSWRDTGAGQT